MAQTITQILLLIISGIAVFTMIVPTFKTIGETQKETDEYSQAIDSAFATNERLNALVRETESLSQQEKYRINRFIPPTVDPIRTANDLETLTEKHKLFLITISVIDEEEMEDPVATSNAIGEDFGSGSDNQTIGSIGYNDFELVVAGTYDQFKSFLADIESSAQLFEVQSINFQSTDSDIIQFNTVIRTFGLAPNASKN